MRKKKTLCQTLEMLYRPIMHSEQSSELSKISGNMMLHGSARDGGGKRRLRDEDMRNIDPNLEAPLKLEVFDTSNSRGHQRRDYAAYDLIVTYLCCTHFHFNHLPFVLYFRPVKTVCLYIIVVYCSTLYCPPSLSKLALFQSQLNRSLARDALSSSRVD